MLQRHAAMARGNGTINSDAVYAGYDEGERDPTKKRPEALTSGQIHLRRRVEETEAEAQHQLPLMKFTKLFCAMQELGSAIIDIQVRCWLAGVPIEPAKITGR